jgi:hypothetical protein
MENLSILDENWKTLLSLFPAEWKEMAIKLHAIKRFRDFTAESLMQALLMHIAGGYSLRETAVRAKAAGIAEVSDVALLQKLRHSREWFRSLCLSLLMENGITAPEATKKGKKGGSLRLFDSTTVDEPGKTGSRWRVHYSLRLPGLECDSLKVTPLSGAGNGESFKQYAVAAGDYVMADRGYSKAPGIEHLSKAGAFVLVRVNSSSLPLYAENGQPFPLLSSLRSIGGAGQADQWRVWIKAEDGTMIGGRLCAIRKSERLIAETLRKMRRRASRNGKTIKHETLEYAKYVIVFTTFPEDEFTAPEIMDCYRLRWQIELAFKRLKSVVQLGHLPKSHEESSQGWLYGKLFVALLTEKLARIGREISPWGYFIEERQAVEHVA